MNNWTDPITVPHYRPLRLVPPAPAQVPADGYPKTFLLSFLQITGQQRIRPFWKGQSTFAFHGFNIHNAKNTKPKKSDWQ